MSPRFNAGEERGPKKKRNGFNRLIMSVHSYTRVWIHATWGTLNRERVLHKTAATKVSRFLSEYAPTKGILLKANYVNADHVHVLFDLPTNMTIEQVVKLLKGASSFWVNKHNVVRGKFFWGRGYGAFSVSQSALASVERYIANQEEHHRKKTFAEEFDAFAKAYGVEGENR